MTLGLYLFGFATHLDTLHGLRLVQGFFASGCAVVAYAILRDQANRGELVRNLALIGVLVPILSDITPILGGILEENVGWRANFFMMAFFGLVLFVFCLRHLPRDEKRRAPPVGLLPAFRSFLDGYRVLLGDGRYMGAVLPTALLFSAVLCYSAVAPFLFISAMGFSPSHFGLLTSLTVLAIMAGNFLCGRIADKAPETMLVFSGLFLTLLASFLLLLFAEILSPGRLLGPVCLLFFGIGFVTPLLQRSSPWASTPPGGSGFSLDGLYPHVPGRGGLSSCMSLFHDGTARPLALCCLGLSLLGLSCYGLLFSRKTVFV